MWRVGCGELVIRDSLWIPWRGGEMMSAMWRGSFPNPWAFEVAQLIVCIYLHWTDRYAYFYYHSIADVRAARLEERVQNVSRCKGSWHVAICECNLELPSSVLGPHSNRREPKLNLSPDYKNIRTFQKRLIQQRSPVQHQCRSESHHLITLPSH
jgi:hypothetical protein